jgi:hypothetical protein
MNDLSDLEGVNGPSARWDSTTGEFNIMMFGESFEREPHPVELGSQSARWVPDMLRRERGFGKIAPEIYDMILTPVGAAPPSKPADPEYKPALGMDLFNPIFGLVRFETNAAILRQTITGFWDRYCGFPEAARGLLPVVDFADRREVTLKKWGTTYWTPVLLISGWIERDKIEPFRLREPTVQLPRSSVALPGLNTLRTSVTERLKPVEPQSNTKSGKASQKRPEKPEAPLKPLRDDLDDEIPEWFKP